MLKHKLRRWLVLAVSIFTVLSSMILVSAAVIDSYGQENCDVGISLTPVGNFAGQAITIDEDTYVSNLVCYCTEQWGFSYNITGAIYQANGTVGVDAIGEGSAIAFSDNHTQYEVSSVPNYSAINFSFSPAVFLEAGDYVVGVEKTYTQGVSIVYVSADYEGTHEGNSAWSYSGNWVSDNDYDTIFYLYGNSS